MASKKESTFGNMVKALLIVTLISSAILGFVYEFTKAPIAQAQLQKKLVAIKQVVPAFDNNPNDEMILLPTENGDTLEAYPAKLNGQIVGYAIRSYTNKGFSGLVRLMVGLKPDGTIYNISVLEHKETPGLGSHMTDDNFIAQFKEKNPGTYKLKVKKDMGDVDAITAATISSRAFCDAVQRAFNAYKGTTDANSGATHTTNEGGNQ